MVSREEASALTVAVLKAKLQELGLPTTGKKDELVARYVEAAGDAAGDTAGDAAGEEETKIESVPAVPSEPEAAEETEGTKADAPSTVGGKKIVFPVQAVRANMAKI